MGGTDDPRSNAIQILDRSIAGLPTGIEEIRTRWDAGYIAGDLARACIERNVHFAFRAPSAPAWSWPRPPGWATWTPAIGMENTELAVIDYLPGTWPKDENVICIARRTRVPAERIPTARARKRRTIAKGQIALALDGKIDEVDSYSFILTNMDVGNEEKLAEVEYWYRHRTEIEELNKNAKHGTAMRHLPSASHAANSLWMWAGLLGCAISAWIQEITGTDHGNGRGRRTVKTIRRELFTVPGRLTRGAGTYLPAPATGRELAHHHPPETAGTPGPLERRGPQLEPHAKDQPKGLDPSSTGTKSRASPCPKPETSPGSMPRTGFSPQNQLLADSGQRYSAVISPSVSTRTIPSASQSAMTMRPPVEPIACGTENDVLPMLTKPLG